MWKENACGRLNENNRGNETCAKGGGKEESEGNNSDKLKPKPRPKWLGTHSNRHVVARCGTDKRLRAAPEIGLCFSYNLCESARNSSLQDIERENGKVLTKWV